MHRKIHGKCDMLCIIFLLATLYLKFVMYIFNLNFGFFMGRS